MFHRAGRIYQFDTSTNLNMHLDRGLQAAVGIVVAFSMLWTIAILIPDKNTSTRSYGLATDERSGYVIHEQYPRILKNTVSTTWSARITFVGLILTLMLPSFRNRMFVFRPKYLKLQNTLVFSQR